MEGNWLYLTNRQQFLKVDAEFLFQKLARLGLAGEMFNRMPSYMQLPSITEPCVLSGHLPDPFDEH